MRPRATGGPTPPASRGAQPRPRVSGHLIHEVSRAVTARDKQLCLDIYEHRFLSTHQAAWLHFESEATARARLLRLWRLRVLDRFRPESRTGSHPWHYVLDEVGIAVVEAQLGVERLRYDRRRALAQVYPPQLPHHTGVNDVIARLAHACRTAHAPVTFERWLGERSCEAHWRGAIHPDGYVELHSAPGTFGFALELDRGTEEAARLTEKLTDCAGLAGAEDAPDAVLFCFPTAAREAAQRDALRGFPILVATAVFDEHMADPLAPNWLPAGANRRTSIIQLPTPHEAAA